MFLDPQFHILALFRKFDPLLFGEIFRPLKLSQILV